MNRLCNLLVAAGVGAGMAYFFDPVAGRRRRALLRDQLIHGVRKTTDRADARLRDLRNRASGTYYELRKDARQIADAARDAARPLRKTLRGTTRQDSAASEGQ